MNNTPYPIDEEGNPKVSRVKINREIEEIETDIIFTADPVKIAAMRARWNYLMTL